MDFCFKIYFLQISKDIQDIIPLINKLILKTLFLLIPFLSMIILTLGCSNKPAEKEMKMPMVFNTKEQAEKEAYNFGCEGAHQMGNKWMPCSMHKHNH